jgi:monoamine oxidase
MTTIIIGGGLSGLALAERLERAGHDYLLLEARVRLGGRILTEHFETGYFDMGPAWFWPGQPRIEALINRFGLRKFDQFSEGELLYEDEKGLVHRGRGFASMQGSWRLEGGLSALIDAISRQIPSHRKRLNAIVTKVELTNKHVNATLSDGSVIEGERVVLAMPPRIAAKISLEPSLDEDARQWMQTVPTWMAGHAKAVAVYDEPFWRKGGLSGDAMSRRGPMVEMHDASPMEGGPYALFGFLGVPAAQRQNEEGLRLQILRQLTKLFGDQAADPKALYLKDWAFDPLTAVEADQRPVHAHPSYGTPTTLQNLWGGRLLVSGTETASTFGGYIEGALEAAEVTCDRIIASAANLN